MPLLHSLFHALLPIVRLRIAFRCQRAGRFDESGPTSLELNRSSKSRSRASGIRPGRKKTSKVGGPRDWGRLVSRSPHLGRLPRRPDRGLIPGMDRPQKITFGEMRQMGVRGILIYCRDHRCSHSTAMSADQWPDDVRLSDIEDRFVCQKCGKRGADVRPDFNWGKPTVATMGYR